MNSTVRETGKVSVDKINSFLETWQDNGLLSYEYDATFEIWVVTMLNSQKRYNKNEMESFLDGLTLALIQVGKVLNGD